MSNTKSVEKTSKNVEDAIAEALLELKVTRDQVEIKILEAGSKGILGLGAKPAKVLVSYTYDPEKAAEKFLSQIVKTMALAVEFEISLKDRQMYINMKGKNMGILIGKRGQTLDSLQYLTNLVINKGDTQYISITLDTENYRKRRKETLESLAFNLAKKAKQTKKNVVLEPMNPYERRIIHSALQNDKYISTYSEGEEPYRYVVIVPR